MNKLRKTAFEIIHSAIFENLEIESSIDMVLRSRRPDNKHADFFKRLTEGTIQKAYTLDAIIKAYSRIYFNKIEGRVLSAIRTAAYEIVYMKDGSPLAAISQMTEVVGFWKPRACSFAKGVLHGILRGVGEFCSSKPSKANPNALLQIDSSSWRCFDRNFLPDQKKDINEYYGVLYSLPTWLVSKIRNTYEKESIRILEGISGKVRAVIYPNTLNNTGLELKKILMLQGLSIENSSIKNIFYPLKKAGITNYPAYFHGRYIATDEVNVQEVKFLNPMPGERICVFGISPHIAAIAALEVMSDGFVLFVAENLKTAHNMLKEKRRLGLDNIHTVVLSHEDAPSAIASSFDKVYVETPSTGIGSLYSNAAAKWKLKDTELGTFNSKQELLLSNSIELCAAGGIVVYQVYSIFSEENLEIVNRVIDDFHHLEVIDSALSLPGTEQAAGVFMAKIAKANYVN